MSINKRLILVIFLVEVLFFNCKEEAKTMDSKPDKLDLKSEKILQLTTELPEDAIVPENMVWIPGGSFMQGASDIDEMAMYHEKPAHKVAVDGFFMDETEVTNAQFSKFINETNYITIAEREIDWDEMKKQLPAGTPKPHDSIMQPGSLVFETIITKNLQDFSQWWKWTIGANWRKPKGPGSSIKGKENEPVVHIAYEDALAYCKWIGHRLPTEAEWEYAASGGNSSNINFWGNDFQLLPKMANTWTGTFPSENDKIDGFENRAPVKSYQPNTYGLYDIAGNVWEWTSDWYNSSYYNEQAVKKEIQINPLGADKAFNSSNPYAQEKIIKGGSFLCNETYCASYRISSRMATSLDSSMEHLGFRTVKSLQKEQ
jgi:formylglycine-generating enzyme required for sulfatase activity